MKRLICITLAILTAAGMCSIPITAQESNFENLYVPLKLGIPDASNANNAETTYNVNFVASALVSVTEGDVITVGPVNIQNQWCIAAYGANGQGALVKNSDCRSVAQLDRGIMILKYTVPAGITQIRLAAPAVYAGAMLLTKNQSFNKTDYNAWLAKESAPKDPSSPLNGLKGLFVGDSIVFASLDATPPVTGRSMWGRIAINTGLKATGTGVGGATIAKCADAAGWVCDQIIDESDNDYDIVVIEGGCNDARRSLPIGSISESEDETVLKSKTDTFAGGLQWTFYNAKKNWPEATLFYMSTFRQDSHNVGSIKQSQSYYNVAEALCEKYGVVYIDLYNNAELNERLESHTTKYIPDQLHPTSEGYDIITPYLQKPIEEVMAAKLPPKQEETNATTEGTPESNPPTVGAEQTGAPDTQQPSEQPKKSGCGARLGGMLGMLGIAAIAVCITAKKRRRE